MKRVKITSLLLVLVFSFQMLFAENLPSSKMLQEQSIVKSKLISEPNRLIVAVNGMCCKSCAIGVGTKVSAVKNVDTEALPKGIHIDRQNGLLTVAVKQGEKVVFANLFDAIRKAGYDPVRLYQLNSDNSLAMTKI